MTIKAYNFTENLANDIFEAITDESFWTKYPKFRDFIESMANETKDMRTHDKSINKKQSQGHEKVIKFWKELFPSHRIEENCTIKIELEGKSMSVEFDIVNYTMRIIIEVDGEHHRSYQPFFHRKGVQSFLDQQARDRQKNEWASDNGWTMIRIEDKVAKKLENKLQLNEIILKAQQEEAKSDSEDLEMLKRLMDGGE